MDLASEADEYQNTWVDPQADVYRELSLYLRVGTGTYESNYEPSDDPLRGSYFFGCPANRQLIKDYTREIQLSLDIDTVATHLEAREPEKEKLINENKEYLKVVEDIIKSVTPESIVELSWDVGDFDSRHRKPHNLFDPEPPSYSIHARNLLQTVPTFTNLNIFQFFSRDNCSRFEDEISKTVQLLPNLEILVIARPRSYVTGWASDPFGDGNEVEMSKLIGQRLSSLTRLKRLHLQGLVSPRASWAQFDWKSPLEYFKVAECSWLYGLAVFPLAHVFRKSLLGLTIGPDLITAFNSFIMPEFNFGKEFEVLEELQVIQSLGSATEPLDHDSELKFLDEISHAPKLKHLQIYFDYEDIRPYLTGETEQLIRLYLPQETEQLEPVWPSLQTIVLGDCKFCNGEAVSEDPLMEEVLEHWEEITSLRYGLLHAEWKQHDPHSWDGEDLQPEMTCRYGSLELSDGKVIRVKAKYQYRSEYREMSLGLHDILLLPLQNEDNEDREDSEVAMDSGYESLEMDQQE